jgi:farnesyl-diphosphate farnesyltransferase
VAHAAPSQGDWDYCRGVLPRVSRTFAINIRVLGEPLARAVRIAYLLCRSSDALEDSWPGTPDEIRERFGALQAALAGDAAAAARVADGARALPGARADLALLANLPAVLRCFGALDPQERAAIGDCLAVMSRGMCRYAARAASAAGSDGVGASAGLPAGGAAAAAGPPARAYLETEAELHDYCWVVAGCVGVMLTRLFARVARRDRPEDATARLERAAQMGEALQLTNILLDWPADVRRGRCYIPAQWLAEHGLAPRDLVEAPRAGQREILDRLERLARRALEVVPEYLGRVPTGETRYRLFCLWPALWAAASIGRARREPRFPWGPQRPRISRARLWSLAAGSLLAPGAFSRAFRPPAT